MFLLEKRCKITKKISIPQIFLAKSCANPQICHLQLLYPAIFLCQIVLYPANYINKRDPLCSEPRSYSAQGVLCIIKAAHVAVNRLLKFRDSNRLQIITARRYTGFR